MANEKKTDYRAELFYQPKHGYDRITAKERAALEEYAEAYKVFLNEARIEREAVKLSIAMAEEKGFTEYVPGMALKPGAKIYYNNRDKALILAVIGDRKSVV